MLRRLVTSLTSVVAVTAVLTLLLGGAARATVPPGFGVDPVSRSSAGADVRVTDVTVEPNTGFDRVVFTMEGTDTFGYYAGYVPGFWKTNDQQVVVEGSTFLEVQVRGTRNWVDPSVRVTLTPHLPALLQLKYVEENEGEARYGLGLAVANGFRVSTLTSPPRLVVDIAH
ncbi:hypothetical protein GCM10009557_77090 [Virgisporangium ochraceum]|uniref:AMIN-like domain-containing protein n=1 Tax=Virgisporangium ochraceum TaxID=65505 RepID=A0A8J4EGQ9_9ACTN|nr:hypothetical protein [Virgisporangium ochraceum]GIJ73948.1 hypothetical protein Voc01_088650 [Virgisporangium ochraceum]